MQELNPRQREAVKHIDTPLLVLAGAGSGKTRVITQKIAHLIRQHGYAAERIVSFAITPGFTDTAMAGDYLESRGGEGLLRDMLPPVFSLTRHSGPSADPSAANRRAKMPSVSPAENRS